MLLKWIEEGKQPFFFMHASDDFYAPRLAKYFHDDILRKIASRIAPLPDWPVEKHEKQTVQQLDLF
jgi:hypothetical protein